MNGHTVKILLSVDDQEPAEMEVVTDPSVPSVAAAFRAVADRLEFFHLIRHTIEQTDPPAP